MYMQINYDLSHGAIFDDLEGLLSQGLKTCHFRRPWRTPKSGFEDVPLFDVEYIKNDTRRKQSYVQLNTNIKLYSPYYIIMTIMTFNGVNSNYFEWQQKFLPRGGRGFCATVELLVAHVLLKILYLRQHTNTCQQGCNLGLEISASRPFWKVSDSRSRWNLWRSRFGLGR